MGQQGVLLRFVPAMDFIYKEGGALAVEAASFLSGGDGFTDLLDPGQNGIDGNKMALGTVGDDHRQRRFAGAGRPIKDERGKLVCLNRSSQQAAWADNVFLADEFCQCPRPHPVGQGGLFFNLGGTAVFK